MVPGVEQGAPDGGDEQAEGDEALSPRDMALFVVRAIRLNLGACLLVAAVVSLLGGTVVSALPQEYEASSKIFVQDGAGVTSAIASGREHRPGEATRGINELLLAQDNLLAIVREARLVDSWPKTRPAVLRFKDYVIKSVFGETSRRDMERNLMGTLATSVSGVKEDDSVRISARWRGKENAFEIATLLQRNFLAARAAYELGPIRRAIPFLEVQLQEADQAIEDAVVREQAAGGQAAATPKPAAPDSASSAAAASGQQSKKGSDTSMAELATLSKRVAEVKREQRALVEPWRRRTTELKTQLIDLRALYSPEHPKIRQLEARIEAAAEVPPEVAELRKEEAGLLAKLGTIRGSRPGSDRESGAGLEEAGAEGAAAPTDLAKARFFNALRKSEDVALRLESTRIELATAEGDFQHRYMVIEEPEVPNKPLKAKKPLLYVVVLLASILLGVVASTVRELLRGRMVESWQVRAIGLPLLADVQLGKLPPPK